MNVAEILCYAWLPLAFLGLLEALYSWREGKHWAADLERRHPPLDGAPPAVLLIPCAGRDPGLEQNLEAYFRQDYPHYRICFVVAGREDASVPVIEAVRGCHPDRPALLFFAGQAKGRGQKVHNLLYALERLPGGEQVLLFGDSDIRPQADWMASLVAGLEFERVAVATGFRWYLPQHPGWASRIRSAWNTGIAGLMKVEGSPFAWGGAMAIRRSSFDECRISQSWQNSLSDDFSLSAAVRRRGLRIRFCPGALSFSHEDCSLAEFWSWSYRQMAITRVYHPRIWRLAWVAQSLNAVTLWGGVAGTVAFAAGFLPTAQGTLSLLVPLLVFGLGIRKANLRLQAVAKAFPEHLETLHRDRWSYRLLGPVASLFTLAALFRSAVSRTIEWRGIRYRMISAEETEILPAGRGQ